MTDGEPYSYARRYGVPSGALPFPKPDMGREIEEVTLAYGPFKPSQLRDGPMVIGAFEKGWAILEVVAHSVTGNGEGSVARPDVVRLYVGNIQQDPSVYDLSSDVDGDLGLGVYAVDWDSNKTRGEYPELVLGPDCVLRTAEDEEGNEFYPLVLTLHSGSSPVFGRWKPGVRYAGRSVWFPYGNEGQYGMAMAAASDDEWFTSGATDTGTATAGTIAGGGDMGETVAVGDLIQVVKVVSTDPDAYVSAILEVTAVDGSDHPTAVDVVWGGMGVEEDDVFHYDVANIGSTMTFTVTDVDDETPQTPPFHLMNGEATIFAVDQYIYDGRVAWERKDTHRTDGDWATDLADGRVDRDFYIIIRAAKMFPVGAFS